MRRLLTALSAVAMLALAACGQQTDASPDPTPTKAEASTVDYDFAGTTLDGGRFDGTSLEGKPAVLWFWAPWCPTCWAQRPNVIRLSKQYGDRVTIVAVGGLDSGDAIRKMATEHIPDVTHVIDPEGKIWQHFGVIEQSTFTVIDAGGKILAEGHVDDDALVTLVTGLAG